MSNKTNLTMPKVNESESKQIIASYEIHNDDQISNVYALGINSNGTIFYPNLYLLQLYDNEDKFIITNKDGKYYGSWSLPENKNANGIYSIDIEEVENIIAKASIGKNPIEFVDGMPMALLTETYLLDCMLLEFKKNHRTNKCNIPEQIEKSKKMIENYTIMIEKIRIQINKQLKNKTANNLSFISQIKDSPKESDLNLIQ